MLHRSGTVTFIVPADGRVHQVAGEFAEADDGTVTVFGPASGVAWAVAPGAPMDGAAHFGDAIAFTVDARSTLTIPADEVLQIDAR